MENHEMIPYYVHEGIMARMERTVKRLWILCIIIFLAFVLSNAAWIYYESQWDVVETTSQTVDQQVDTGEGSTTVTGIGDIYYGTDSDNSEEGNN